MYLIAEAGSTKCDWLLFDEKHSKQFQTEGINPTIQLAKTISNQLKAVKSEMNINPSRIFFYGAGCNSTHAHYVLTQLFKISFPDIPLFIGTDLLAACRASCNNSPGIVCILGTGSNAALTDGHIIQHNLPSLGYLLGDEGSGNHLGKELLKIYFSGQLDDELKVDLELEFPTLKNDFLYNLYHSKRPSALLASFAKFVIQKKQHPQITHIINDCIEAFIHTRLLFYKSKNKLPIYFCGSIASFLLEEINRCLNQNGFQSANSIQKPILQLMKYHLTNKVTH